jgi:protein TonB
VDISLVTFHQPYAKQPPPDQARPVPRPQPKPKPAVAHAPIAKTVAVPPPVPRPIEPEPIAEPRPVIEQQPAASPDRGAATETARALPAEGSATADQTRAAVQVSVPRYDVNPPIDYPRVARRRHYQGTALLDVRVTAEGRVAEVRLARSSGYAVLDRSALSAVRAWRFEPARRGPFPIETWVQVPVRFVLK